MPDINPLTNNQIFLKKIAENTGSDYETGDVSEINPLTIDQILLKEIAANTAGQSGDITELEEKVSATQNMVGDAYDSTHTYNVGDYCIYENALYKCNTASTTGDWDSSKWDAVTVAGELGGLTAKVENSTYELVGDYNFDSGSGLSGQWHFYRNELTRSCRIIIAGAKITTDPGVTPTHFGTIPTEYKPLYVAVEPIIVIYNDVNNDVEGYVSVSNVNGWLVLHKKGAVDINSDLFVTIDWFY